MNWQNKEDEIKRIIETREFEYDERDWLAAQKLIAGKTRNRRLIYWLTGSLVLATALFTWWMFPAGTQPVAQTGTTTPEVITPGSNNIEQQNNPTETNTYNSGNHGAAGDNSGVNNTGNSNEDITTKENTGGQADASLSNDKSEEDITLPSNQSNNHPPDQSLQNGGGNTPPPDTNTNPATQEVTPPVTKDDKQNKEEQNPDKEIEVLSSSDTDPNALPHDPTAKAGEPENPAPQSGDNKDEDKRTEENNTTKKGKKPVLVNNTISVVAGANYSGLYRTGRATLNSPYLGALFTHRFSEEWHVAGGLGYTLLNSGGLKKEYSGRTHGFGIEEKEITITTNRLHYAEMPLFVKYSPKPFISLTGGLNFGYLLTTNNTLKESGFTTLGGTQPLQEQSASMYMRGINRWDMQLQLGAEAQLREGLYLGFLANGGLFDVGIDKYYNNTVFERNTRLQLYIRFNVYSFKK